MSRIDQFIEAVKSGKTEEVKKLLENGANIHTYEDGALQYAAQNGHTETAKGILEHGADIPVKNDYPLQWAVEKGHTDTVKLLLEKGAHICKNSHNVLQMATSKNHVEITKLILEQYKTPELQSLTKNKNFPQAILNKELKTREEKNKIQLAGLDLETGGLDPQTHGICSIAIITDSGKIFQKNVSPQENLTYDKKALAINGFILKKDEEDEPIWAKINPKTNQEEPIESEPEETVLEEMLDFLQTHCQKTLLCGVNVNFDISFLKEAAKRYDRKITKNIINPSNPSNTEEPKKSHIAYPLEINFLRNTMELQTLALRAHMHGEITLPPNEKTKGLPHCNLNAIVKATINKTREDHTHDALEDAKLALESTQSLANKKSKENTITTTKTPDIEPEK